MPYLTVSVVFPDGLDGEEFAGGAGDPDWVPGSGKSSGEGNGSPLQCTCLENSVNRRAGCATVHGVAKSQTWLSSNTFAFVQSIFLRTTSRTADLPI